VNNQELEDKNLDMVFKVKEGVTYDEVDNHVRVIVPQNKKPQVFMRKLGIRIPKEARKTLDDFGSVVFKQINGINNVEAIGKELLAKYPEANVQLYDRLLRFLHHLEVNEKWIEQVK